MRNPGERDAPKGPADINWNRIGGILVVDSPSDEGGGGYGGIDTSKSGATAMATPEEGGGGGFYPTVPMKPSQELIIDSPEDKAGKNAADLAG